MRDKILVFIIGILFFPLAARAAAIVVTSPTAGVDWCQGSEYLITWTISGRMDRNVKINLRTDRIILVISASTENDGSFLWRVPNTLAPGSYIIRVRTLDNLVYGDSALFNVCSGIKLAPPKIVMQPKFITRTMNIPVEFRTEMRHKYRHQWNCLLTIGMEPVPDVFTEFKVGFISACISGGTGCAEQCRAQIFRARPVWNAALLRPLIGKTLRRAILEFRHASTRGMGSCAFGLKEAQFYIGFYGPWDIRPSEVRPVAEVSPGFAVRIDVTEMMSNWLREEDPSYRGESHNYGMILVGKNERLELNNSHCLSLFDQGRLYIEYID